jgi:hypothetical protein
MRRVASTKRANGALEQFEECAQAGLDGFAAAFRPELF